MLLERIYKFFLKGLMDISYKQEIDKYFIDIKNGLSSVEIRA